MWEIISIVLSILHCNELLREQLPFSWNVDEFNVPVVIVCFFYLRLCFKFHFFVGFDSRAEPKWSVVLMHILFENLLFLSHKSVLKTEFIIM